VREIEIGIGQTGIRAGIIKCVTGHEGLTKDVDILLRASAHAHLRTGVPITTHSDPFRGTGLLQQALFREEGVDLSRVIIGHTGCSTDLDYIERIIEAGSYVGMDRFGEYDKASLEDRVRIVAELCDRGYASRITLSHDRNCGGDIPPDGPRDPDPYHHIERIVLPALRERGVAEADLDQMLSGNPMAIFGPSGVPDRDAASGQAGDAPAATSWRREP
jgi:phosphotriesterase-related protein